MKNIYVFSQRLLISFSFICFIYLNAIAEGTKQIRPTSRDYGFVVLDPAWSNFALYGCAPDNRLQITICNANEKIYYGFRQTDGDVKYRIKNAAGTIVVPQSNIPTSGAGFISTYNQAFAGPSALAGAAGYNALVYTAPVPGDYYIEFLLPGGNPRRDFEYFDITVASPANAKLDGRVWSKSWMLSTRNYGRPFKGLMYIYADDGIVTSLNFNGMDPYVFVLNANNTGTSNTGNATFDRRSKPGVATYPQYKVFLNDPDINCFPTGQYGTITQATTLSGCPPSNFCINIFVDRKGHAEVLMDLNGISGFQSGTTDRILSQDVFPPSTCISWDGKDGLGNFVTAGIGLITNVNFYNGLTHIPLYDVEQNPNGYIVSLVRPAGPAPKLFWDDSLIPAASGSSNLTGCTSPCHTWNWNCCGTNPATDYGNSNTIDTWWYADSTKSITTNIVPPVIVVDADTRTNGSNGQGNDTTICGSLTTYALSGSVLNAGGGVWSTTGSGTFSNNTAMNGTYNVSAGDRTSGLVKLILTSTGNGACPAISDTLVLRFQSPPIANAGAAVTVCANNPSTVLNGTVTNAPGGIWSTAGSGSFSPVNTALNATYTPSAADTLAGSVTLTLSTTGINRCPAATSTKLITIQSSPTANAGPDISSCSNSTSVTLAGSGSNANSYIWSGGAGTYNPNNTTLNATYSPTAAEKISGATLTLSAIRTGCNNATDVITIKSPSAPTVSAGSNQTMCYNNSSVTLAGVANNADSQTWTGGAGTFSPSVSATNAVYTPTLAEKNSGSITLTLTANKNGCNPVSSQMTITITSAPTAFAGNDANVCFNNPSHTLSGASFVGATGIVWTGNGGTFVPNANTLNATYTPSASEKANGIASLILSTTGNGSCSPAKDTVLIIIQPAPTSNAGPNKSVCSNNPVVALSGSASNASTFTWTGGTGTYSPNNISLNTSYTPSPSEISAGNVTLTLTSLRSGCLAVTSNMSITITPPPTVNAGSAQSVCYNNSTVTLSGSITIATGGIWSGGSGTFSPNNTTLNAQYTPSLTERNSGAAILTLTTTGNGVCNSESGNVTISITPAPSVNANSDQSVCSNNPAVSLKGSVAIASGGTWTGPGTFSPNANALNAVYTPSASEISAGSTTLTLTSTGNGNCSSVNDQMMITFTPAPIVNAGPDKTVCADNPAVSLSGSVSNASGGIWSGGSGTFNPNNTTLNATYSPTPSEANAGIINLTLTSTGNNNCNAVSSTTKITISPAPSVNAGTDQTICGNVTNVSLTGVVTGSSGGTWTTSGTGTFTPNANTLNAVYKSTAADRASGSVTLTLTTTGNGTCIAISDQMIINFTPAPSVNAGTNQTICSTDFPVKLSGSGSSATWSGGTGTFSPDANTLNASYTPSAAEVAARTVDLTLTTTPSGACPSVSDKIKITIPPGPKAIAGPSQTVCGNFSVVNLKGSFTNATGVQWTTSGTGNFFPNAMAAISDYYPSMLDKSTGNVTLTLTTTGNGFCTPHSDMLIVSFTPIVIVDAGPDQTICADNSGIPLVGSITGTTGGTWSSSGTGTFNPNANIINATYIPSANDKAAGNVTLTLTSAPTANCTALSDAVTFTITPAPTVDAGPDQTICSDASSVALNGTSTVASGVKWTSSGTGTFSPNSAVKNATYIPSAADKSSGTITLTLTTTGNGICSAVSDQVVVTISKIPTVNAGVDQTVCADIASVNLNGAITIASGGTWTSATGGTFSPNANTLNASYTPSATDILNGIATLTLTSTGNGICTAVKDQMIIFITPAPKISAGTDRTVCANNAATVLSGTLTVASGAEWTGGSGTFSPNNTILNATYTPSAAEISTGSVILTITSTGNGTCKSVTDQMTISITSAPTITAGPDQTICADSISVLLNGSYTVATEGVWTSSGSGTFFPANTSANANYMPAVSDRTTGTVTLTFTTSVNGNCKAVSDEMIISITPAPTASAGTNQIVCANNANINLNGTVTVATGGTWKTSGTGTFANANSLNTTYTPSSLDKSAGTVNLTLTTSGNGTCKSVSSALTLTILTAPNVNAGPDQNVCRNNSDVKLNGAYTVASGSIWTTSGSGTFSPNATTSNAIYHPSVADETSGNITLTLSTTGNGLCNAVTDEMNISITPSPTINAGTDQTVCADITGVNLNGNITVSSGALWTSSGTGTFTPNSATLNASYKPSPADTNSHSVTLTLTSTGNGTCNAINDEMIITINAIPIVDAGADQTVCGDLEFLTIAGTVTNATGGTWTTSGTGSFSPDANSINGQHYLSAADLSGNSVTLTLTSTGNGTCKPVSDQKIITINPVPGVNAGADKTVCANNPNVLLNGAVTNASGGAWISSGDGVFTPDATSLNATYTPSANDIAGGSVVLTLQTIGNGACNSATDQMIVNISPSPTVDAGADQSVCANNSLVNLSGSITISSGATWTTSGSGSFTPSTTALNAVYHPSNADTTAGSVTLTLSSTGNGNCIAVTDAILVTITDAPSVNPGTTQTICANSTGIVLNGTVTAAGGGTWSTSSGTGTFSPDANTLNATFVPSQLQIDNGRANLTLTSTANGNCLPVSSNVIVNIQPVPTVNAGADILICAGTPAISLNGNINNASGGTWTIVSGGSGTFNPNANTLNASYIPSVAENSNNNIITLALTSNGNGSCSSASDQMTITFNTIPSNAGPDQVVCSNSLPVKLNGSGSGTWSGGLGSFSNANALNSDYNPDPSEIGTTVTLTISTVIGFCSGSDNVQITIKKGPTADANIDQVKCSNNSMVTLTGDITNAGGGVWTTEGSGVFTDANTISTTYTPSAADLTSGSVKLNLTSTVNGICNAATDAILVSFTPAPTLNAGSDQLVCSNGGAISLNGSVNGAPGATWSIVTGSGTLANASILNTNYTPTPSDTLAGIVTLRLSTTLGTCTTVSDDMNLTFGPSPKANVGSDQTICGDASGVTLNGSVSIASGGVWSSNGSGSFTPNENAMNAIYIPSSSDTLAGIVTLTLTTTGNGTCNPVTDEMIIHITDVPTVNAGANQTVCGDILSLAIFGTITTATGGHWTTSGTGTFGNADNRTTTYTPSATDKTAGNVTLTLSTTGNGTCNAVSSAMSIILTPAPTVNAGSDQTACNDVISYSLNPSMTIATGSIWTSTGTGTFGNANSLNTNYIPSPADTASGSVTLTITTNAGLGTCNAVNDQLVLTFTDAPSVNAGTDRSTCSDKDTIQLKGVVSIATGAIWTSSGTGTFSPNAAALDAVYSMSAADTASHGVTLTLSSTGNGTCVSKSDQVIINIVPKPIVNAGADQTICAGQLNATLNGSIFNAGGGIWTSSGTGTFSNAGNMNSTYSPSVEDNEKGGIILTLTSTGTPSCNAASDFVLVNLIPAPSALVNAGFNQTVCKDISAINLNGFVSNAGGGVWTSPGTGIFSPDANTLDAKYFPSNADKTLASLQLTLTTTDNGICSPVSDQITISFTPVPTITTSPLAPICADETGIALLNGSVTVASGGVWTSSGTGIFSPDATTLNATYFPSAADKASGNIGLTLTTTGNGTCNAVSSALTLKINKAPTINAGIDKQICANTVLTNITASFTGATGASWTTSGSGTFVNANAFSTFYRPSAADTAAGVVNLTAVTTTGTGTCTPVSDQVKITFIHAPIVNAGPDQTICSSGDITLTGNIFNAAGGVWSTSGSGNFSNNIDLSAVYTPSTADIASGTVSLSLASTGNGVCASAADQVEITIQPKPVVDAGTASICNIQDGAPLNATFSNTNDIIWSTSGTGTFALNAGLQNATYYPSSSDALAGSVILTVTSSGSGVCDEVSNHTILNIESIPLANAGKDQYICTGSSTVLIGQLKSNVTYNWSTTTGTTISDASSANISANSDTSFVFTITNEKGCFTKDTVNIYVFALPTLSMNANNCLSDTLVLNSNPVGLPAVAGTFQWYKDGIKMDGQNASILSPNEPGNYRNVFSYGTCFADAVTLVNSSPLLKTMKLIDCENNSSAITITSNTTPATYTWSDGQSGLNLSSIKINVQADSNYYTTVVTDASGCSSTDSVLVIGIPTPILNLDNLNLCQGTSANLNGIPGNVSNLESYNPVWEWKRNKNAYSDKSDSIRVSQNGTYSLKLTIGQCNAMDTSVINIVAVPLAALPDKIKFCKETQNLVTLDAGAGTGYTYAWKAPAGINLDSTDKRTTTVRSKGIYAVTVTNSFNCPSTDSVLIDEVCPPRVFVPNAFSPDSPGGDKYFKVFGANFTNYKMMVFNRWGEVIFISSDRNEGWDGMYGGEPMPIGVYPWVVTYEGEDPDMRGPFRQDGSVTIVR